MKTIELTNEEAEHIARLCKGEITFWELRAKNLNIELTNPKPLLLSKSILEKL